MTIRERRRRRRRRRLIKRLSAAGLILFAVGAATLAILAATNRQEAAEPPFSLSVGEMPTISPEAATEPTEAPQRGRDLGWNASEEYIAVRMAMAEAEGEDKSIPADPNVRNFSYTVVDTEGKALVILVIYNRTKSGKFPDTVKGVISQRNAFTSYSNGRYEAVKPDADCWAALDLIQETGWDESQGALYFEQTPEDGESTWHSRNLERLFIHGNHTFYTEKEAKDP